MNKVMLGTDTPIEVGALALGTDLFGSRIDRETAFILLDYFQEQGGTLLDTGNFYASWLPGCSGGESERTIGAWLTARGNRDHMVISTKLGFDYPGSPGGLTAAEIEGECNKSLKRLQTDRLDLYYAHRDDRSTDLEETMQAFDKLVRAGKVRVLGASNLPVWRIAEANVLAKSHGWTAYSAIQQRYTYLRPRHGADFGPQIFINQDLKDYAESHGISLVGYSVLLQGTFTRGDKPLPAQFEGPDSDARLEALRSVAGHRGISPNQVVIAWLRQSKPPILPIIAGSKVEQLRENIEALDLTLTPDEMDQLDTAGNPVIKQAWIKPS